MDSTTQQCLISPLAIHPVRASSSASINQSVVSYNERRGEGLVGASGVSMYESAIHNHQMIGINVTEKCSVSLRGGNKVYENPDNSDGELELGRLMDRL